ncbi:MAG: hypothetical protein HWD58_01810 [Bacteroidota bacterium]|nr:MAG: hypothetical protein HWD58_01810 [Bacteroidota bacterium]
MRVRLAYYSSAPAYATLTHPCNLITFSETEDYLVNITNAPGTSFVASGTAGACSNPAVVSIGTATNNNTAQFVQVRDSNNNYVCRSTRMEIRWVLLKLRCTYIMDPFDRIRKVFT